MKPINTKFLATASWKQWSGRNKWLAVNSWRIVSCKSCRNESIKYASVCRVERSFWNNFFRLTVCWSVGKRKKNVQKLRHFRGLFLGHMYANSWGILCLSVRCNSSRILRGKHFQWYPLLSTAISLRHNDIEQNYIWRVSSSLPFRDVQFVVMLQYLLT